MPPARTEQIKDIPCTSGWETKPQHGNSFQKGPVVVAAAVINHGGSVGSLGGRGESPRVIVAVTSTLLRQDLTSFSDINKTNGLPAGRLPVSTSLNVRFDL